MDERLKQTRRDEDVIFLLYTVFLYVTMLCFIVAILSMIIWGRNKTSSYAIQSGLSILLLLFPCRCAYFACFSKKEAGLKFRITNTMIFSLWILIVFMNLVVL